MSRPRGSKNKPKVKETKEVTQPVVETAAAENTEGQQEDEVSTAPPAHIARNSLLNEIHKMNKERSDQEGGTDEEAEEITETPSEPSPEEVTEPEKQEEVKEPETATPVVAKRKFKIDGKEVELTEDEIIERVQKSAAADKRLEETTRMLEDARRATLAPKPSDLPPAGPSSKADVGDDDLIKNATKAVMYGDEEQVTKAFEALLARGRSGNAATQTNVATEIQSYVTETLAFEKGKQLLETPPEQGGYSDVWSDPMLKGMFQRREAELRDVSKDTRPYADLYKAIGDEIRTWRDALIAQNIPKTGLENRDQLKAKTGVVRGAGGKVPTTPLETKPKTLEEKIEGMRSRRGLN